MKAVDFVHPDDREMVWQKASDMLRGNARLPYEFRTIGKDGRFTGSWSPSPPSNSARAVPSWDSPWMSPGRWSPGTGLRSSKPSRPRSLKSIPHAVIGLKNRQIIFANDGVEKVFGWKREEVIGKSTRISTAQKKNGPTGPTTSTVPWRLRGPSPRRSLRKKKDGTPIICRLTASRIGEALVERQVVITYEDITDQKAAEEVYMTMAESSRSECTWCMTGLFNTSTRSGPPMPATAWTN